MNDLEEYIVRQIEREVEMLGCSPEDFDNMDEYVDSRERIYCRLDRLVKDLADYQAKQQGKVDLGYCANPQCGVHMGYDDPEEVAPQFHSHECRMSHLSRAEKSTRESAMRDD